MLYSPIRVKFISRFDEVFSEFILENFLKLLELVNTMIVIDCTVYCQIFSTDEGKRELDN